VNSQAYRAYSDSLRRRLEDDPSVVGLVAVGSMAQDGTLPDEWSDHDFFVITAAGAEERFRTDLSWLPDADRVALWFRETEHGLKVLYDSGHLVEFAVFGPGQLESARINRARVLLDRADVAAQVARLQDQTARWAAGSYHDDRWLLGQLLTALVVGVGRFHRGELASAHERVKGEAVTSLLRLVALHLTPAAPVLDSLDPRRRVERAYPALAAELDRLMVLPIPEAAGALLDLARRELSDRILGFPNDAASLVAGWIAGPG
jgi:hypothetical protein